MPRTLRHPEHFMPGDQRHPETTCSRPEGGDLTGLVRFQTSAQNHALARQREWMGPGCGKRLKARGGAPCRPLGRMKRVRQRDMIGARPARIFSKKVYYQRLPAGNAEGFLQGCRDRLVRTRCSVQIVKGQGWHAASWVPYAGHSRRGAIVELVTLVESK